jgi:hypothetical protein
MCPSGATCLLANYHVMFNFYLSEKKGKNRSDLGDYLKTTEIQITLPIKLNIETDSLEYNIFNIRIIIISF